MLCTLHLCSSWSNIVYVSMRSSQLGVSKNTGTPKSSHLIGFSIIYHPFWVPLFLETPNWENLPWFIKCFEKKHQSATTISKVTVLLFCSYLFCDNFSTKRTTHGSLKNTKIHGAFWYSPKGHEALDKKKRKILPLKFPPVLYLEDPPRYRNYDG